MIEEDKSLEVMRGYNARTVDLSKRLMEQFFRSTIRPVGD